MSDTWSDLSRSMGLPREEAKRRAYSRVYSGDAYGQELLSPEAQVPASVRFPRLVQACRLDATLEIEVVLSDGGVWRFDQGVLVYQRDRRELTGDLVNDLFERQQMRFHRRLAPRRR